MSDSDGYMQLVQIVGVIAAIITFVGGWIYCIATYGFLIGVGLGWLPSLIAAFIVGIIAGYLWPLLLIGILYIIKTNS